MNIAEFKATLDQRSPPSSLSISLTALWYQAQGDWEKAHQLAQQQDDAVGYWIHAYLHRVEGNFSNAGYWYNRAGRSPSKDPLKQEWTEIASAIL